MQINELKLKRKRKPKKIIGRGGKRGTYSGKGIKGQKSRSGVSIKPLFEGGRSSLIGRLKKIRGFKSKRLPKNEVKLSQIEKNFSDGDIINLESLIKKGLVSKKLSRAGAKILQDMNKFSKKVTFEKDILLSSSIQKIIGKNKK